MGFSLSWLLLLQSTGSWCLHSISTWSVVAHGFSCSAACGILRPRDRTCVPCVGRQTLYHWTTREVPVSFNLDCTQTSTCISHHRHATGAGGRRSLSWKCCCFPLIWSFCCFRVTGQVLLCLCLSPFGVGNFQRLEGRCSYNLRYAGYTVAKYKFLSDVIWGERGKSCLFVSMEDRSLLRHGIWWSYYLVSKACLESEGPEAMACQKDFKFHICLWLWTLYCPLQLALFATCVGTQGDARCGQVMSWAKPVS